MREVPGVGARPAGRDAPWLLAGFSLVITAGVVLRFVTTSDLWLDEALTVNIASLPLGELVDALRRDGAPPLYYVLLHGWISAFGDGDGAVRSLSGVFSVAALPLMWAAGRRLGGRPVAIAATVLLATSPFAIRYATEARMYSLVMLLVLAGWLLVRRGVERPSPLGLAGVAAVTGLLLLTQYWAFYLVAVAVVVLAVSAVRRRSVIASPELSVIAAMIAGGLLFIPWVPHFLYQLAHTGTPWGTAPFPVAALITTATDFSGGPEVEARLLLAVLGALAVLAVFGRALDRRRIELDLATRPGARAEAVAAAATVLLATTVGLAAGSAFASRYSAVVFPIVLLVSGFGVRALGGRDVVAGVLVVAAVLGLAGGVRNAVTNRTQAGQVAETIHAGAQPRDVVVYCPDQLGPSLHRLVDVDVQLSYPTGGDAAFVDWVDYEERNAAADPVQFAAEVLERAGDATVWHVWAPGYRTFGRDCEELNSALAAGSAMSETIVTGDPSIWESHNLTVHRGRAR